MLDASNDSTQPQRPAQPIPSEPASPPEGGRERGATLLFALAILALLVLFSTVFARLMSLERRASAYYTDRVRAKLAARAGIERAVVELRAVAGQRHFSDPFVGKWIYYDDSNSTNARPSLLPAAEPNNLLNTVYPSFYQVDDPDFDGNTTDARTRYGTPITYSGYLGQPYDDSLMCYRLKIVDTARQLNLNNPDSYAANRMLKNLLRTSADLATGTPTFSLTATQAETIATALIPADGGEVFQRFRSKPQIQEAFIESMVTNGISGTREEAEQIWLRHLRDRITVYSWEDPDVIRPWALNRAEGVAPRKSLGLMPRSPINLNTASVPVLTALFAELAAETRYGSFEISYDTALALAQAIVTRRGDPTPNNNDPNSVTFTGSFQPFRSWPEFENWLDTDPAIDAIFNAIPAPASTPTGLTAAGLLTRVPWNKVDGSDMIWAATPNDLVNTPWVGSKGGLYFRLQNFYRVGHRDLIKAMLNPNTMLNKFGTMPNHGGFRGRYPRMVDKSDIVRMTTEGCFDSLGVFEITSTGVIFLRDLRDPAVGYEVHAGHTDSIVVRVYTPFRVTTQRQLEEHRAFMVAGNFITAPEKRDASAYVNAADSSESIVRSTNAEDFFDDTGDPNQIGTPYQAPGWPGMVTWPQYSLKRVDTLPASAGPSDPQTVKYPMPTNYNAASWDGHMTLTNMITVRTGDHDFLAGFARGQLSAFKCRAWWEPKDIQPTGGYATAVPTRPVGNERRYLSRALGGNGIDMISSSPRLTEAPNPATPSTPSELASVLKEDFDPAATEVGQMFAQGSSLINTGVMIGPDRAAPNGQPAALAYDSNNIDLSKGTSIRFWVQPLRDPYAQEEEVLFYFKGSNGSKPSNSMPDPHGNSGWTIPTRSGASGTEANPRHGSEQQAGFRVVKRVSGDKIEIVLEDIADDPIYAWARPAAGSTGGFTRVDVTPSIMSVASAGLEAQKPDPTKPEWIPGTWHWVVVNIGPGLDASGEPRRQAFASLQIDKCGPSATQNTGKLYFKGNNMSPNTATGNDEWGCEVYAVNVNHPSSATDYMQVVTPGTSSTAGFQLVPRQLGDFYHCTQYDPLSQETSVGIDGKGAILVPREFTYGGDGASTPPSANTVFEYYRIRGPISGETSDGPGWQYYPDVWSDNPPADENGPPGWYRKTANWPNDPFPVLISDRSMYLGYGGGGQAVDPPASGQPGWEVSIPDTKIANGSLSIFGPEPGHPIDTDWPRGTSDNGKIIGPYPGADEWDFQLIVRWNDVHYMGRSPWAARPWPTGPHYVHDGTTTWLPADMTTMDMVPEHPADVVNPPRPADFVEHGGRYPYGIASSAAQTKNTAFFTGTDGTTPAVIKPEGDRPSYVRSRTGLTIGGLGSVPLDAVDDDCQGCEDCDIDGPVFFGGAPDSGNNYTASGALATPDADTMACAVFDNIVFVNGAPDRRTDYPDLGTSDLFSGGPGQVNLGAKAFEDRFYEEDLAAYLTSSVGDPAGTGAVYHRGLLELRNRRFRLSSMTWTSYRTRVTGLDYEVALWKIDDEETTAGSPGFPAGAGEPPTPEFRYANADVPSQGKQGLLSNSNSLAEGRRDVPHFGMPASPPNAAAPIAYQPDPTVGVFFGPPDFAQRKIDFLTTFELSDEMVGTDPNMIRSPYVDGLGNPATSDPAELLILGVRLRNTSIADPDAFDAPLNDDYETAYTSDPDFADDSGVLVSPVLETPVFEDVTLNLTFVRPQYLYAEEGAIE